MKHRADRRHELTGKELVGISRKNLWEKRKGFGVADAEVEPGEGA